MNDKSFFQKLSDFAFFIWLIRIAVGELNSTLYKVPLVPASFSVEFADETFSKFSFCVTIAF